MASRVSNGFSSSTVTARPTANATYGARAQKYRSDHDNALALAILAGILDERDIPRYATLMTGNKQIMEELAASGRNELERERKQREWMRKRGIE